MRNPFKVFEEMKAQKRWEEQWKSKTPEEKEKDWEEQLPEAIRRDIPGYAKATVETMLYMIDESKSPELSIKAVELFERSFPQRYWHIGRQLIYGIKEKEKEY